MSLDNVKRSWENLTPAARLRGVVSVVVLVLALGWIVYLLWPEGDAEIPMTPEIQTALDETNADLAALRAMPLDQLKAEVAKREAALQAANKSGTGEQFEKAMSSLGRAKDVYHERRSAEGG